MHDFAAGFSCMKPWEDSWNFQSHRENLSMEISRYRVTLVQDMWETLHRSPVRAMYVCMYVCMYVRTVTP